MAGNYLRDSTATSGPTVLLLRGITPSPEDDKLVHLLDVLGITWQSMDARGAAEHLGYGESTSTPPFRIISSAHSLAALIGGTAELPAWMAKAESVFIYGFAEGSASQQLLRALTGDSGAEVHSFTAQTTNVSIVSDLPELCGPMAGLRFRITSSGREGAFHFSVGSASRKDIVDSDQGPLFVAVQYRGVQFFLSSSSNILDVLAPCSEYFDVKENFCSTVPLVMWTRWVSGLRAPAEIGACLIVDDPPLKPRYGFLNYQSILNAMVKHNFATTIAFIPWNWNRNDARTVQLFRQHPDKLSLCVHGCDHTASEFAEQSTPVLNKRINVANHRMELLRKKTLLPHDNVMVFPQGAFSSGALGSLKLNGFAAAVNTPVSPVRKDENQTKVDDLLRMAIMKYGSFPLFTRRYVAHGVENFAFDGLLGKPCLIAAHHDDFANDSRVLLQVISQLNSLHWKLRWRPLGETIRQACTRRRSKDGSSQVEMYGSTLVYENSRESAERTTFLKLESDADKVNIVAVNGEPVDYVHKDGYLQFETTVPPNERVDLHIVYLDDTNLASSAGNWKYRATAIARRYLSEFRDNYLSRNTHLQQRALKVKQALGL